MVSHLIVLEGAGKTTPAPHKTSRRSSTHSTPPSHSLTLGAWQFPVEDVPKSVEKRVYCIKEVAPPGDSMKLIELSSHRRESPRIICSLLCIYLCPAYWSSYR